MPLASTVPRSRDLALRLAFASLWRPLFEAGSALLLTALLVAAITSFALSRVSLEGLPLNVLPRNVELFRNLGTAEVLVLTLQRSSVLLLLSLAAASLAGIGTGIAFALSTSPLARGAAWALGTVGIALPSFFWAMVLQLGAVAVYATTGLRPFAGSSRRWLGVAPAG